MKFKDEKADGTPGPMADFFKSAHCHPDIISAAIEFEHKSIMFGWPQPLVSDLQRTSKQNAEIYFARYLVLRELAEKGDTEGLTPEDRKTAESLKGKKDPELWELARKRSSWHCYGCAIDFSGHPYDDGQLNHVLQYLRGKYRTPYEGKKDPPWEFLLHTVVGSRAHFHIGRRDPLFRAKYLMGGSNA